MNKQKNQLGNIIPFMYIKIMIHDKNKRKTQVIGIKKINISFKKKTPNNYKNEECPIVESRDESPRVNLAHPNFFTFSTAIGVKGCLFFPLSLKCASNNTGAV